MERTESRIRIFLPQNRPREKLLIFASSGLSRRTVCTHMEGIPGIPIPGFLTGNPPVPLRGLIWFFLITKH
jgi:hypothetical protein